MSTKCPYCRRRYQHAAAYEKHVRAAHHDILLFRRQTAEFGSATSSVQISFIEDATANQRDTSAWTNLQSAGEILTMSLTRPF